MLNREILSNDRDGVLSSSKCQRNFMNSHDIETEFAVVTFPVAEITSEGHPR